MTADVQALIFGTVLAVVALAFVLYPLFFGVSERRRRRPEAEVQDDSPIVALREIEFDRATGKLSESDYAELKGEYSKRALSDLRAGRGGVAAEPSDAIEARVLEYRQTHRECPTCGVRPEADATYCSTCGGYLPRSCPGCRSDVSEPGAAFCSRCGTTLAPRGAAVFA
jgi:cytochrome c-type biogenesis protein CcmI